MKITTLLRRATPLCFLPSGKLVAYRYGYLLLINGEQVERKYRLFTSAKERIAARCRYLYRLLRLGITTAAAFDENAIVLCIGNTLYEFDFKTGFLSEGYFCGPGIRPLQFSISSNIPGIDDGIYFGGYLGNRNKKPVHIYKRVDTDKWEIVHTFPQGTINHVHAIIPDKYRNCLWIFSGDFGDAAAIWKVTDNFNHVERIFCNDQKYRGCVGYALPEGLLYATDAPFADNFIYLMDPDTSEVSALQPIEGSCIYGCRWKDKYVFSTTVEGDGRDVTRMQAYFGRKRGAGIKDDYVHLIAGNIEEGFKELYRVKKDFLPLCSFQFGVIKFPHGVNNRDKLVCQPVATTKHDLSIVNIEE